MGQAISLSGSRPRGAGRGVMKFILSPGYARCAKCGGQFDPRVQSAACHKKVRHYPVHRISEWQPPSVSVDQSKRQPDPRSPK